MKNWVKERLQSSGADVRLDHTIDRMTNHEFTPAEIKALEDRSLTALELPDALRLGGIQEGPPVDMHPGQKAIIDRLMNRIGGDPLAGKARDAYGRALQTGQIRVR